MAGDRGPEELPFADGGGGICIAGGKKAARAGSSLKRRSPDEVRVVRASGNEISFGEEIVMGDNSTNVVPFNFGEQQVRTLLIAGEPWFVAADVCRVLEVGNTTQAVQALDEDERSMFNIGRQGNANLVNESGLYTLILRSRDAVKKGSKPHAFRKWVTSEVLPSIRKAGHYEDCESKMPTLIDELIGMSELSVIKGLIRDKGKAVTAEKRQSFALTMHNRLHTRFNVPRTELIPAGQFEAACNFIAAYNVLEGEFLGKEKSNSLSMSLQDWVDACPVTRHAQAGQPAGRVILTGALCSDMDTVKPLQRLINQLAKQGVDVTAYEAHYHFLLEYLRENRRFLRDAHRLMEKASENEFAFRTRVAA